MRKWPWGQQEFNLPPLLFCKWTISFPLDLHDEFERTWRHRGSALGQHQKAKLLERWTLQWLLWPLIESKCETTTTKKYLWPFFFHMLHKLSPSWPCFNRKIKLNHSQNLRTWGCEPWMWHCNDCKWPSLRPTWNNNKQKISSTHFLSKCFTNCHPLDLISKEKLTKTIPNTWRELSNWHSNDCHDPSLRPNVKWPHWM